MLPEILGIVKYLRIHIIWAQAEGPLPGGSLAWQVCVDAWPEDGEFGDIYALSDIP